MNTYLALVAVLSLTLAVAAPALLGLAHERRIDRQIRAARAAEAAAEAARRTWGITA